LQKNDPSFLGFNPTLSARQNPLLGATPNIQGRDSKNQPVNLTLKSTGASLNSPIATLPAGYSSTSDPSTIIAGQWNLNLPNTNQLSTGLQTPLGTNAKTASVGLNFSRQMTDRIEFFVESMYSTDKSFQDSGVGTVQSELGGLSAVANLTVPATSPVNPFQQ